MQPNTQIITISPDIFWIVGFIAVSVLVVIALYRNHGDSRQGKQNLEFPVNYLPPTYNQMEYSQPNYNTSSGSGPFFAFLLGITLAGIVIYAAINNGTLTYNNPGSTGTTTVPAATQNPAPTPAVTSGRPFIYTVVKNDYLSSIAQRFNTSVAAIKSANPIITDPSLIYAGWKLIIPSQHPEFRGIGVTLREGESLQTLADRAKIDLQTFLNLNGLKNEAEAKPGDLLLLPS